MKIIDKRNKVEKKTFGNLKFGKVIPLNCECVITNK